MAAVRRDREELSSRTPLPRSGRRGLAFLAACLALLLADGPAAAQRHARTTPPKRSLYVWDNAIPGDTNATWELIGFANQRGIDTLLLECSPVGYAQPGAADAYGDFVAAAHASGLEVFALAGYPWWTVPDNAGIPGQTTGHSEN